MSLSISHVTFQIVFVRLYGQFDTLPPLFTLDPILLVVPVSGTIDPVQKFQKFHCKARKGYIQREHNMK